MPAGLNLDLRRTGFDPLGELAPERDYGPLETTPDLLEGHRTKHRLRWSREDTERVRPREQPPNDGSRDPEILPHHVAGITRRYPVPYDRAAQLDLARPVRRAVQKRFIERVWIVSARFQALRQGFKSRAHAVPPALRCSSRSLTALAISTRLISGGASRFQRL